jgi:hypothetical protein
LDETLPASIEVASDVLDSATVLTFVTVLVVDVDFTISVPGRLPALRLGSLFE